MVHSLCSALTALRLLTFETGVRSDQVTDPLFIDHESHCSKSKKRMHTSRAALNRLLDENDTSQTLTTLASAAAALGKKVDLELLDQRSVLRQLIFSL